MKVLITREIPQAGIEILEKYPQLELDYRHGKPLSHNELLKAVKGANAVLAVIPDTVDEEVLKSAGPNLKLIAHYAVGYDNIDLDAATKTGVYVSNTPGDLTESVAEFAFALMMAVGKHVVESDKFVRHGDYKYWDPLLFLGPKFMGKTLGIVGFGRIGQSFARMAKNGLGMKIIYVDTKECTELQTELGARKVDLDYLLENSDVVSIHCNLTDESRGMIGEKELKKMKPTAYLINTSRGSIVNEAALATALKEGWIEGAGLDVFEKEPEVYSDLLALDNVVLTPHIASATREARIQMARMAAENIVEVLVNKRPPINLVNTSLLENKKELLK